jgi:hypothetical protein
LSNNFDILSLEHPILSLRHEQSETTKITTATTALHCTALHCTALHFTALHCTALHCTSLHYFVGICCANNVVVYADSIPANKNY